MLFLFAALLSSLTLPSLTRSSGHEERIARSHAEITAFLGLQLASGALQPTLAAIDVLLEGETDDRWFCTDFGCSLRGQLLRYQLWNRPPGPDRDLAAVEVGEAHHPFAAIVDTAEQLARHDVILVVVPLPTSFQIYPEFVPGLAAEDGFPGLNPGTSRLLLRLLEAGVEVVPTFAAFARERGERVLDPYDGLFYRSNMHWTPRGAELGARLVAEYLSRIPGLEKRGSLELSRAEPQRTHLVLPEGQYPPRYFEVDLEISELHLPAGAPEPAEDRASPLLLLADSFGFFLEGRLRTSFRLSLCQQLGRTLDSICVSAGCEDQVRMAVARRGDDLAGKRVVVWMLQSNMRCEPSWRKIPLFRE